MLNHQKLQGIVFLLLKIPSFIKHLKFKITHLNLLSTLMKYNQQIYLNRTHKSFILIIGIGAMPVARLLTGQLYHFIFTPKVLCKLHSPLLLKTEMIRIVSNKRSTINLRHERCENLTAQKKWWIQKEECYRDK